MAQWRIAGFFGTIAPHPLAPFAPLLRHTCAILENQWRTLHFTYQNTKYQLSVITPNRLDKIAATSVFGSNMADRVLAENTELIPRRTVKFVWCEDRSTASWYAFYVLAPGKNRGKPDRKYHGGWNGERLARNIGTQALQERHPQVYEWMLGVLKDVAS
jgi:hypothetical protein